MSEFVTLVAALDDTPSAENVLQLARALVEPTRGDRLFCVHAPPAIPRLVREVLFPYTCFGEDEELLELDLAKRSARHFRTLLGEGAAGELRMSEPGVEALLAELQTIGPELLVVGADQYGGGASWELGPVARELARRSSGATVFARRHEEPVQIRHIVVGLDLAEDSVELLSWALALAHRLEARLTPLIVVPTVDALDHARLHSREGGQGRSRKSIQARWGQIEGQLELPFPVVHKLASILQKPDIVEGDPGELLVAEAAKLEADLLVVGRARANHGTARLGRVAEYVVRHAPCPVATLGLTASAGEASG